MLPLNVCISVARYIPATAFPDDIQAHQLCFIYNSLHEVRNFLSYDRHYSLLFYINSHVYPVFFI